MFLRSLAAVSFAGLLLLSFAACEGAEEPDDVLTGGTGGIAAGGNGPGGQGGGPGGGKPGEGGAGGEGGTGGVGTGGTGGSGGGEAPCTRENFDNPDCIACAEAVVATCMAVATSKCPMPLGLLAACASQNDCGSPMDPTDFDQVCLLENCFDQVVDLLECTVVHCTDAPVCIDLD